MLWKPCTKCKTKKPAYLFNQHRIGKFGLDSICKRCHSQRIKDYRQRLREAKNGLRIDFNDMETI